MNWRQHKWKVLLPLLAAAILVFAYWYGGNAPGAQGWTVSPPPTTAVPATPSPSPSPSPASPMPSASSAPVMAAATASPSSAPSAEPTPAPEDDEALVCTLSISCAVLLDHMDDLDQETADLVPQDGWLLPPTQLAFAQGESVFDALQRACRDEGVHLEFSTTPLYHSAYIEGIGNLYEFDCGELSGWMYQVNGAFPSRGCSRCELQDGDVVCWQYTRDLGKDLGVEGGLAAQRENGPEA